MWIDAVLGELLEIHRKKPTQQRGVDEPAVKADVFS
jgi:hypothetical protein